MSGFIWKNDRNFDIKDCGTQRYYYVFELNDLISKLRQDLNARKFKVMDFVISKVKSSDKVFATVNISMYELKIVLDLKRNSKNYSDLAKNIGNLIKKDVLIYKEEKNPLFKGFQIDNVLKLV
ncbi:hypothetical protein BW727_200004 (plasmid) [Jeotgalibaca dankookensis]|uniref:Initiator Rep protein WH1 domain-containing protein n=1 Tax=Jeotgalibaca dankookensis TaxID=708126 RepID=A0A1S6IS74_9LACT|nr:RepB family plasmid replication initiator protein [Jeotgalibaca dankookensis]AQS54407.1 hypothetical protein BW727_200004 [Jeotgalibaca dankookensis]